MNVPQLLRIGGVSLLACAVTLLACAVHMFVRQNIRGVWRDLAGVERRQQEPDALEASPKARMGEKDRGTLIALEQLEQYAGGR